MILCTLFWTFFLLIVRHSLAYHKFVSQTVQVYTCTCIAHKVLVHVLTSAWCLLFALQLWKSHFQYASYTSSSSKTKIPGEQLRQQVVSLVWYITMPILTPRTTLMCSSCWLFPVDRTLGENTGEGTMLLSMPTPVAEVHEGCGSMGTM